MFVPKPFQITDRDVLYDLIEAYSFGTLVATQAGAPFASHIPFVLERDRHTLVAHVAKANPQGALCDGTHEMLAIFQGPHGYISPNWYGPGNAVPTWNYTAVHVYGAPKTIDDPDAVRRHQNTLVATFEGPDGWNMDSQPDRYIDGMLRGIVAFEMQIARIEGKFKFSQNRSEEDRHQVIEALEKGSAWDQALAGIMRDHAF
ncbi:MAG: FMN-binding negative transcriptional regulator [Alphaproteobacteria bacterium]|nr:FMN-binding negative transcriptional regulator [Alphaproteobacteria bacterium]